jgi:DNA-directed RNA polymerase specialized sigma24 family protein
VRALGGRARRALQLAYAEGCGRDRIAAELGIKPNGVKTLLQRLRRVLADCVSRRRT